MLNLWGGGYQKVSIIEFGVAGGNGLVNIEYHVKELQKTNTLKDMGVEVYGFDIASGMPKPGDYRDIPYLWKEGFYKMDISKLQSKLGFAKLVLGDVKKSLENFSCAPIACVMIDLDYYSSTVEALKIFLQQPHLPRVFLYFDDVVGANEICLYNKFTGELLAIEEFNKNNDNMKIVKLTTKDKNLRNADFIDNLFVLHDFGHKDYTRYVNFEDGLGCNLR